MKNRGDQAKLMNDGNVNDHSRSSHGEDRTPSFLTPPQKSKFQIFFHFVRLVAVLISLSMMICQFIMMARDGDHWLQNVLRLYVVSFCLLFISSELQLEDRIRCMPASKSWVHRGFLYTFIAVIGYEETTTLIVSEEGHKILSKHAIVMSLKVGAWSMFGLGLLYAGMGMLCFRKLRDRMERRYSQEKHDRERLTRMYEQEMSNSSRHNIV